MSESEDLEHMVKIAKEAIRNGASVSQLRHIVPGDTPGEQLEAILKIFDELDEEDKNQVPEGCDADSGK